MRWTRDKRGQISLRTAQFMWYCIFNEPWTDSRDPCYTFQGCQSFCRGGFNKPCTWNDPFSAIPFYIFLFNLFVESTKCESRQRNNNLLDFVLFGSHFWIDMVTVMLVICFRNTFWKFSFSVSFGSLQFYNFGGEILYRFTSGCREKFSEISFEIWQKLW